MKNAAIRRMSRLEIEAVLRYELFHGLGWSVKATKQPGRIHVTAYVLVLYQGSSFKKALIYINNLHFKMTENKNELSIGR